MNTISLIANTGIQVVSFRISVDTLSRSKEWFHEWHDPQTGEWKLEMVHEKSTEDGRFYYKKAELLQGGYLADPSSEPDVNELYEYEVYPIKVDDEMKEGVSGDIFDVSFSSRNNKIKDLENQWLPVPYFFMRGERRYTFGPLNWSRMMLVPVKEENGRQVYDVILAFDTRTVYGENQDRKDFLAFSDRYSREIKLSLCKNELYVADYCASGESWSFVNDRLMQLIHPGVNSVSQLHGANQHKMAYAATYIFLINFLAKHDLMPKVQVFKDMEVDSIDVDMVIDIGNSRTTALLIEDPHNANFTKVRPLSLLDFTDLYETDAKGETRVKTCDEPFDMRLAFRKVNFGKFGPKDSLQFVHPSLIRLGVEANELIRRADNRLGDTLSLSTYSSPKRYLWDWRPTHEEWQFLNLPDEKDDHVVYLPGITSRLKSDGKISTDGSGGGSCHYSPRSLMTFAFMEMLVQATRQINSPDYRSIDKGFGNVEKPRRLRKIIITCPTAMSRQEREALVSCAKDAVAILARFDGRMEIKNRIEVIPDTPADYENPVWYYDEATCSQLVYMYGEVGHKYRGNCGEFFSLYGKVEPGDTKPSLTIGSLDIGAGTSDLMISRYDYETGDITTIIPEPLFYDSFYTAGDDMVRGMVKKIMLLGKESAFRHDLKNISDSEYRQMMRNFFGPDHNFQTQADRILRKDFNIQYSVPLMYHFLELLKNGEKDRSVTFDEVFGSFPPNENVIEGFKERTGIDVRKIVWRFKSSAVAEVVEQEFEPLLKKIAAIMHAYACDIVLLSGRPSSLHPIRDIFLKYYAVSPDRLIILNNYYVGNWYPFSHNTGNITNPKTIVAMGGMIGHYASTLSHHKFVIDLEKLNKGLKSTVNYIEAPSSGMETQYIITPDRNSASLKVSNLPLHLKIRQIDLESYDGRNLYTIDFNRHKIADRIRRKGILVEGVAYTDGQVEELVKEEIENLRHRMSFTLEIERDPDDSEKLNIMSIMDKEDKEVIDSNIEIHVQSLGTDERYWLDTGEFNI